MGAARTSSPARPRPLTGISGSGTPTTCRRRRVTRPSPSSGTSQANPRVFSLGIGPWISVGWNAAGLSLTGNELSPNDERIGVPRLLMVREQLTATTMDEAVAMALRSDRSSSYNTVFATPDGRVVNVEGSATDAELERMGEGGTFAHTNHYACARMAGFEGDHAYARRSAVRLARARGLLDGAAPGTIDAGWMRAALSDHATTPSLCRHVEADSRVATAFWCIADVTAGEMPLRPGQPVACPARSDSPSHEVGGVSPGPNLYVNVKVVVSSGGD